MFPGRETDLIKEMGIDVIHIHGVGFVGIKGIWASWHAKVPRVSTFHTMIHETLAFYSPFGLNLHLLERGLRFYLRIFLRKTHGVVVPSRAILDEILALSPSAKIADVIPTGVDTDRFRPDISGQGVRTKWGLNGNDVILHVGRVAPEKNLTTLIHAFPKVLESNPDTKLMIVGTGPYMEKYYDLVRHLGLAGDVIFTGFVPDADLPKYYAAADAFAIASKFETQGLVVLEALASGRPVAGANYRAIPEFVHEGVNGALFEPNDVKGCAAAILRCLREPDGMREAARETALRYSVERGTERRGPGEGRNRGAAAAAGHVLLFVDADCLLPSNLIESVFLALGDPSVVGGATGFAPASGRWIERSLFYLANAYQRAMTIWGIPHNAGYCFFFRTAAFETLGGIREDLVLNETHDLAIRSRSIGRFVLLPIIVETSMRRFRTYGYLRTILQEYVASTILYYATGRSPRELFRPAPAR